MSDDMENNYNQRLMQLEQQLSDTQAELARFKERTEPEALESRRQLLETVSNTSKTQLADVENLKEQIHNLKTETQEAIQKLHERDLDMRRLTEDLLKSKQDLDNALQERERYKREVDIARSTASSTSESSASDLRSKMEKMEQAMQESKLAQQRAEHSVREVQEEMAELKSQRRADEQRIDQAAARESTMEKTVRELKESQRKLMDENSHLNSIISDLRTQLEQKKIVSPQEGIAGEETFASM